ncbi:17966_t:CDS:2, partial [Gigaspora rosea]
KAVFEKLNGTFEAAQIEEEMIAINFELNQGITENDPNHYFIQFGPNTNGSFTEYHIVINPPKAATGFQQFGSIDDFASLFSKMARVRSYIEKVAVFSVAF